MNQEISLKVYSAGKNGFRLFSPKDLTIVILVLAASVTIAFAVYEINLRWAEETEKAIKIVGAMFAILTILPLSALLIAKRTAVKLGEIISVFVAAGCILLIACYLFQANFYITFPADFLIWSESDYVNDILKFRAGYPIFSPEINNESFAYPPGSQLLTYFLARLIGQPDSIVAYRAIQLGYTILSAIIAFLCCRQLTEIASDGEQNLGNSNLRTIIGFSGLFLIATNTLTNPFTHLLHNDALAQLVNIAAYWLLLKYETSNDKRILWLMIFVPASGFWVKQRLIIWAVLYVLYIAVFSRLRSPRTLVFFSTAIFISTACSMFIGYAIWRDDFVYWVFTVLGKHAVSPLRSFKHLLDVWIYFAIGIAGGAILLRGEVFKRLFGHWLIWLILISSQTYTSGVAWMLNHIGSGSLIAGVWFFAALPFIEKKIAGKTIESSDAAENFRAFALAAGICLIFSGLGVFRIPVRPFDEDSERYVKEIKREFSRQPHERVLLDFGTWIYLPEGIVMKDRAPTVGERGYSQTGDFSGINNRLKEKYYAKILVRNLHSPDFWYDHESWAHSSNIRENLLENYKEVGTIEAVKGFSRENIPYGFGEISILVPAEN